MFWELSVTSTITERHRQIFGPIKRPFDFLFTVMWSGLFEPKTSHRSFYFLTGLKGKLHFCQSHLYVTKPCMFSHDPDIKSLVCVPSRVGLSLHKPHACFHRLCATVPLALLLPNPTLPFMSVPRHMADHNAASKNH